MLSNLGYVDKFVFIKLTRPNGPILGAKDDVAPTSPPTHLKYTKINIM